MPTVPIAHCGKAREALQKANQTCCRWEHRLWSKSVPKLHLTDPASSHCPKLGLRPPKLPLRCPVFPGLSKPVRICRTEDVKQIKLEGRGAKTCPTRVCAPCARLGVGTPAAAETRVPPHHASFHRLCPRCSDLLGRGICGAI